MGSAGATIKWQAPFWSATAKVGKDDGIEWLSSLGYKERPLEERNLAYVHLGQALIHLGNMGASDKQLAKLARKGVDATFEDIARIYCKNLREGDARY